MKRGHQNLFVASISAVAGLALANELGLAGVYEVARTPVSTTVAGAVSATSNWAKIVNGSLAYQTTAKGDRIMDFSSAGYGGGGVALPTNVPARITLSPTGGDDTAAIQAAIDTVSARDRGSDRFRGAVKLGVGTFRISRPLVINAAGVVVAGSGTGTNGTIVQMTGTTGFRAFNIGAAQAPVLSNTVPLASAYIKSGSDSVRVESVAGFAVGQRVQLSRTVTAAWLRFMGMDSLTRDGAPQTWIAPGTVIATPRAISSIDAGTKTIRFDAPITDSFDATYLGSPVGTLSRVDYPARVSWVGVENLKIVAPAGSTVYSGATFSNVINGYLNDVVGQDLQNSFNVARNAQQITFERVITTGTVRQNNAAPTADFSVTGSQVLLNRCQSLTAGNWGFVTGGPGVGPTVLLNFTSGSANRGVAPHQRWYTGVLVDSATLQGGSSTTPGIAFTNRRNLGSGHGWTTGWSVAWNVISPYFAVQSAPGTINWCIGCVGNPVDVTEPGIFDAAGNTVAPASLFLQQLLERRGAAALSAIGYASTNPAS